MGTEGRAERWAPGEGELQVSQRQSLCPAGGYVLGALRAAGEMLCRGSLCCARVCPRTLHEARCELGNVRAEYEFSVSENNKRASIMSLQF